jgi:two-component system sensor histidine kinase HydH
VIRIPAEPWRGRIVGGLAVLGVGVLDRIGHGAWAPLYSLPVALAALREGWPGGLAAASLSAILLFTVSPDPTRSGRAVEALSLLCLGLVVGLMAERDRSQKSHYQKLATQLSSVYEKVQANFEGMKRAERLSALGQLSAGLAHEIRNPLASISGAAAILQRNQNLDPKQVKCIEIITNECQRLNGLLTNFLNFARPRPPRFQTVGVDSLLDNVLALAGHGVRGKTVHFDKHIEPGLPLVECDPEQLEQVLLNLMINAIEATPDGDTVQLSAVSEDQRIVVQVIDHGHGVAPSHVDRLFDPFFTTKEHGTGLGLPVAHQIMRQMGGSLLAQRNSGHGMTLSVILPAKHADT